MNSDNEGIRAWDDMRWRDAALLGVAYSATYMMPHDTTSCIDA